MDNDIDKIRHKTGIDKLETRQRKKLFDDFVEHGGQVIEEKKQPKETITRGYIDRSARQKKETEPQKQQIRARSIIRAHGRPTQVPVKKKIKKKKRVKIRDLMGIYVRGLVLKVFTVSGRRFSDDFIHITNTHIKESLLDLDATIGSFLKGETSIKKDIHRLSIAENSTFYEFLLRLSWLYDEKEYESISKVISDRYIPAQYHLDTFKKFFKRMYILGQYTDLCKLYTGKSLDIQMERIMLDPGIVPSLKAQLKKDINILLDDYLMKFHIVLCRLDRTYYQLYSQKLDDFLEMTDRDKIGYITQEEKKKRLEELKRQKEYLKMRQKLSMEKEKEEIKVPKHVERGFPLLEKVLEDFESSLTGDEIHPLFFIDKKDKMLKSIVFFDHFDDQYSFILTTSKISFNIDYREQKKLDIKEDLNRAYLLMSEAREEVKNYLEVIVETKKTDDNLRLTVYQKQLALDSLSRRQSVLSKNARIKLATAMKEVENVLSVVISDYNTSKRFLQNPDTVLYFDKNVDGEKKLHGKKIIEAIIEAFLFASSFVFLLNFGELSGSGLYIEQQETEPQKKMSS